MKSGGRPAGLRLFPHAVKVHGIQFVDDVLHECFDHVRGLRVHDSILTLCVQQRFVQAPLHCVRTHVACQAFGGALTPSTPSDAASFRLELLACFSS